MPKFRAFIKGENFLIRSDDSEQIVPNGFYVNAFIDAHSAEAARDSAITLVRESHVYAAAHNTADDPTRYVPPDVLNSWREIDPMLRVQRYLTGRECWNESTASRFQKEISREIDRALSVARNTPPPMPEDLLNHTYAELTRRQAEQLREYKAPTERGSLG